MLFMTSLVFFWKKKVQKQDKLNYIQFQIIRGDTIIVPESIITDNIFAT